MREEKEDMEGSNNAYYVMYLKIWHSSPRFIILPMLLVSCVFMFLSFLHHPGNGTRRHLNLNLLTKPLSYNDPELIQVVKERFLNPPSSLPYNLMKNQVKTNMKMNTYDLYQYEIAYGYCKKLIQEIFSGVKSGFFVEAGAIDGEYLSNTLDLEIKNGWTGLLVEVDGKMFKELLTKNRRVWSSHCCLATHASPHKDVLLTYAKDRKMDIFTNRAASAHASLLSISQGITLDSSEPGHRIYEEVQCLPLGTLLLAIGALHVDLVSLDVEGAEVGILENFPWNDVTVDVWVVEHASPSANDISKIDKTKKSEVKSKIPRVFPLRHPVNDLSSGIDREFMEMIIKQGYELYSVSEDLFIPNYVFVLRNSTVFSRLYKNFQESLM